MKCLLRTSSYLFSVPRSGSLVPPIAVCRLLLVLDYMLFQFSEPAPDLSEQVGAGTLPTWGGGREREGWMSLCGWMGLCVSLLCCEPALFLV